MTSKRTKLQEDTHFRVLRLLQENPEMSQRELAAEVGVSVGGMHYVLNALIEKGLVIGAAWSRSIWTARVWRFCTAS